MTWRDEAIKWLAATRKVSAAHTRLSSIPIRAHSSAALTRAKAVARWDFELTTGTQFGKAATETRNIWREDAEVKKINSEVRDLAGGIPSLSVVDCENLCRLRK